MFLGLRILAVAPAFDEEHKIGRVVSRVPRDLVDQVLVIDDGSRDGSARVARENGALVIELPRTGGVGAAIRRGYAYGLEHGFDVVVTMAGNDKDAPEEIPLLLAPIAAGRADFVQGSRFLKKGANFGHMPLYRRLATRLHPLLFSLASGRRVTESTNGFRAVSRKLLADPRLRLDRPGLDAYELEPYLYLKAIELGYQTAEVAVTKIYPPRALGQTKMKPLVGWWSILRPLLLFRLGRYQ